MVPRKIRDLINFIKVAVSLFSTAKKSVGSFHDANKPTIHPRDELH